MDVRKQMYWKLGSCCGPPVRTDGAVDMKSSQWKSQPTLDGVYEEEMAGKEKVAPRPA